MRTPKKSETIEIRLSHDAKAEFMERCRRQRRTASETIRLLIQQDGTPVTATRPAGRAQWRTVLAALLGAALGLGAAAPSLARSIDTSRAAFERLDLNHDGRLDYAEFRSR